MEKEGIVPRSSIDTDARRWDYSHTTIRDGFSDINSILDQQQEIL
jgi:hypothetical protein